jgi:hypothetical protein
VDAEGLENTGRIGRVVIRPRQSGHRLACALGHAYGPQAGARLFRTTDGGKNWTRNAVRGHEEPAARRSPWIGQSAHHVRGMWQLEIHTWGRDRRRSGQRPVHVARRRRDVDEADRPRSADQGRSAR